MQAAANPESSNLPRINAATRKLPTGCPHCGCKKLVRKGTRRKKLEIVQLWQCTYCRRVFTPLPPAARNTTYPPRVILDALTIYNLGYPLAETARRLRICGNRKIQVMFDVPNQPKAREARGG